MSLIKRFVVLFVLFVLSVAIVFAAIEATAVGIYWIRDGKYVSVADKLKNDPAAHLDDTGRFKTERIKMKRGNMPFFPSPYLAYVEHTLPPYGLSSVNRSGFIGPDIPLEKTPGVFVVLVSGGSVARHFYNDGVAKKMEAELNAHYTTDKIKKFVVLNGAVDGWLQPQIFNLLAQKVAVIDGFITIEGWNEGRAIFQRDSKYLLESPDDFFYSSMACFFGYSIANVAYQWDSEIKRWQRQRGFLQRLKAVYFLTERVRNFLRYRALNEVIPINKTSQQYYKDMNALPVDWSKNKKTKYIIEEHKNYIRLGSIVTKAMGVKAMFIVQPAPVYGKVLTPDEQRVVKNLGYRDVYLRIAADLMRLKDEDVPIYNFLDIFRDHPESLYTDQIHVNAAGSDIMREKIQRLMETEWGFHRSPEK